MPGLSLCAFLCAAVLAVSGVAKLRSREPLAKVMDDLGLPGSRLPGWLVGALPLAEAGLGVLVLVSPGVLGVVVDAAVVALFVVYTALIARVLRRAEGPVDCHCFGDVAPGRVTGVTLARNIVLVVASVAALLAMVEDGRPLVARLAQPAHWSWWVGALLCVAGSVLVVAGSTEEPAGREEVSAPEQDDDPGYVPVPTPMARVRTSEGAEVTLRQLSVARPQLLLFVRPGCGPCSEVISAMPDWARTLPEVDLHCVVADDAAVQRLPDGLQQSALVDFDGGATQVMDVRGFPTAWLLGVDQQVAGGPQTGPGAISRFVEDMRAALDGIDFDALAGEGAAEDGEAQF